MEKYLITLVNEDERTVLEIFDTKDAALVAGLAYRRQISRDKGLISCISTVPNENGQLDLHRYRIHHAWS